MKAAAPPGRVDGQDVVYSVSGLTEELKTFLSSAYRSIWVEGEVSGSKVSPSGHAYFNLKDENALLACVVWRSTLARMKLKVQDGRKLRVRGGLDIYPPRGSYQLIVELAQEAGEGELARLFEELKKRLSAEGLFDPARKRPIPAAPRRVAVVTSPTGAAIRDFLRIVREHSSGIAVQIVPASVQGKTAAREIADGVRLLDRLAEVDVIVVMRGGGSLEDLWAFNEEELARALYASKIPVISAVGHEIDFTISDFVADLRAPTPTAAAHVIVRHEGEMLQALRRARERMIQAWESWTDLSRERLARLLAAVEMKSPLGRVALARQTLDRLLSRQSELLSSRLHGQRAAVSLRSQELVGAMRRNLLQRRHRVQLLAGRLSALNPRDVLARGFAVCVDEATGAVLRNPAQTAPGNRLRIDLSEGRLAARVE